MFETIVIAMDGSTHAESALLAAVDLARKYEARIVIAHVEERIPAKGGAPPVRADEEQIKARIRAKVADLAAAGVEATAEFAVVALGGPAHALVDIAEQKNGDLIVAGTRGYSSVSGLLVGSVTHRLLHISKVPVLAVPLPK